MATVVVSEKKGRRRWLLLAIAIVCIWFSLSIDLLLWPFGFLITGLLWVGAIVLVVAGSSRRGRQRACSSCGARLTLPLPFACPSCREALSWGDADTRTR